MAHLWFSVWLDREWTTVEAAGYPLLWGIFLIGLSEVERPTPNVANTISICLCLCICLCGTAQMKGHGIRNLSFSLACFQFSWQVCLFSCCEFPSPIWDPVSLDPSIDRRPPALQQPSNRSSTGGDCWDILPYELSNSWDSQPLPLMNYPDHVM